MTIVVTGAAGFIGFHLCGALLRQGHHVLGLDSLNDYYDVSLKTARLSILETSSNFSFAKANIADAEALQAALQPYKFKHMFHLAAQAGVRYSLENPSAYIQSNLVGHANILELCRHHDGFEHLIYASSSSVYGGNEKTPFSETDPVDRPVSLYAATKKADELMSHTYGHLYRLPQTGVRFFTVYGPWGRPDMAYWIFTRNILEDRPIRIFNNGDMRRDFTYIDDIVAGLVTMLEKGPAVSGDPANPHRIYNMGNNRPEELMHMIDVLETELGKKAARKPEPMQPGDVKETFADLTAIKADYGFEPKTSIEVGLPKFVQWYKQFFNV